MRLHTLPMAFLALEEGMDLFPSRETWPASQDPPQL